MGDTSVDTAPELNRTVFEGIEDLDDLQLRAQGHVAELPRQFTLVSMLAFAIAVTSAWVATTSLLPTHLMFGGPAAATWMPLASGIPCLLITLGMSELASAFPSAGGQYHFAFMVAPVKHRAIAAFFVGWMNAFAWLFTVASVTIYPAELTGLIAEIYSSSYKSEAWHIYLIYVSFLIVSTAIVVYWSDLIPRIETILFYTSLLAAATYIITFLAASDKTQSAKTVLIEWAGSSGWNPGLSFLLDLGQGMWIYIGVDSTTHLSEEIRHPGKNIPIVMIASTIWAIFINTVFTLAILFRVDSFSAIASAALPIEEAMKQAIPSDGAILFLLIWLNFVFVSCVPGCILTTGRLLWAFARDNGLPFSSFFRRVDEKYKVPVEASVLSALFAVFYGLIYIGSTVAFNTFISTSILFAFFSYAIPQGIIVSVGRDTLPERYFDLGKVFGTFTNIFSVVFMMLYAVLFCFPLAIPTTVASMNYVSVVFVGGMGFITISWFVGKRKTFSGPDIQMEVLHAINADLEIPADATTKVVSGDGRA